MPKNCTVPGSSGGGGKVSVESPTAAAGGAASRRSESFSYIAGLDGIRAIAVVAVILFHVYPPALHGGFTGVDVFYVLSGFLITSIVLQDLSLGRFSLREFYVRRVQRLAPNAILTIGTAIALWGLFMMPSQAITAARHGIWALFNLSNFFVWRNLGGYWGNAAEWAPLTHTWSLGIEEQFYLLFPGLLLLLYRRRSKHLMLWLGVAAALSFVLCVVGTYVRPVPTFYLLPTRVWELLMGSLLAVWLVRRREAGSASEERVQRWSAPPLVRRGYGWLGVGLIVTGFIVVRDAAGFPGWVALLPTGGTVLLILAVTQRTTRLSRLLSAPLMVATGKMSYSLYLWHWPMIIFGKSLARLYGFSALAGSLLGGVAGLVLGWVAYRYVESPLRRPGAGRSWRLAVIGSGFAGVAAACLAVSRIELAPSPFFDRPAFLGQLYNAGLPDFRDPNQTIPYRDVYFPPPLTHSTPLWSAGGVQRSYGGTRPQVVLLGSSHGMMYAHVIDDLCRERSLSAAFLTADGKPVFFSPEGPTDPGVAEVTTHRRQFLREWRPEVVFVIDRWDYRFGSAERFESQLRAFLQEVSPLSGMVVFVTQVPVAEVGQSENLREFITWRRSARGEAMPRLNPDGGEPVRREVVGIAEKVSREFANVRVVRADQLFYEADGSVRYADGRQFFYADDDHLADAGAERVRSLFGQVLAEAIGARPVASKEPPDSRAETLHATSATDAAMRSKF